MDLYKAGKVDDAIAAFRQAVAADPKNGEALTNLGLALDARGKDDEAVPDFEKALTLNPSNSIAESDLGLALYHEKKYAGVDRGVQEGNRAESEVGAGVQRAGRGALRFGHRRRGIASYRKTLDVSPNFVDAMNNFGVALDAQGKYSGGGDVYARAVEIDPQSRDFRSSYASTLHSAGRDDDALAQYREVVSAHPDDAHSWSRAGRLLILDGAAGRSRDRADEKSSRSIRISRSRNLFSRARIRIRARRRSHRAV